MTLNLLLLYFVWTEEHCQTSPNKNKSPNLWHVTSILFCCIFGRENRGSTTVESSHVRGEESQGDLNTQRDSLQWFYLAKPSWFNIVIECTYILFLQKTNYFIKCEFLTRNWFSLRNVFKLVKCCQIKLGDFCKPLWSPQNIWTLNCFPSCSRH